MCLCAYVQMFALADAYTEQIHTSKMRENGFLAKDVNLKELAVSTKNFTGAEIQG